MLCLVKQREVINCVKMACAVIGEWNAEGFSHSPLSLHSKAVQGQRPPELEERDKRRGNLVPSAMRPHWNR